MYVLVYSTNTIYRYIFYIDSYFAAENATKTFAVAIVEAPGTKVPSAPVAKVPKAVFRLDMYVGMFMYSCIFLGLF